MTDRATDAVFVSYAREDSDPAGRIAEALRAHGIEVWLDRNELRGADAWDPKNPPADQGVRVVLAGGVGEHAGAA